MLPFLITVFTTSNLREQERRLASDLQQAPLTTQDSPKVQMMFPNPSKFFVEQLNNANSI